MEIFSKICNKKVLAGVFLTLAFFLFPQIASAGIGDFVSGIFSAGFSLVGSLAMKMFSAFMFIFMMLISGLASIAGAILSWVTDPGFITVSFTQNEFVLRGWEFTRDLANMGFAVFLALIGLFTALRMNQYQWQKTLPRLLMIILLINFTPVITGAIIDAANIIMNFFLQSSNLSPLANALSQTKSLVGDIFNADFSISGNMDVLFRILILMLTAGLGGLIFLAYAIVFLLRYIMLWLLIILSPIAFFTYVFKESGVLAKIFPGILSWDEWWNQFLQWAFVGVTLSFFLYLTALFQGSDISMSDYSPTGENDAMFNHILPYFLPLAIMVVGLMISITSAPAGASQILGKAKSYGSKAFKEFSRRTPAATKWMGKKAIMTSAGAGKWTYGVTKEAGKWTGSKLSGAVNKIDEKAGGRGSEARTRLDKWAKSNIEKTKDRMDSGKEKLKDTIGPERIEKVEGAVGKLKRKAESAGGKVKRGAKGAGGKLKETIPIINIEKTLKEENAFADLKKKYEKQIQKRIESDPQEAQKIISRGAFSDVQKAIKAKTIELMAGQGKLSDSQIAKFKDMEGIDFKESMKKNPIIAPILGKSIKETVLSTKTKDMVKNYSENVLENLDVHRSLSLQQLSEIGKKGTFEQRRGSSMAFLKDIKEDYDFRIPALDKYDLLRKKGVSKNMALKGAMLMNIKDIKDKADILIDSSDDKKKSKGERAESLYKGIMNDIQRI